MAERESFEIRVAPEAARQIRKLDGADRRRLDEAILNRRDLERWLRGR